MKPLSAPGYQLYIYPISPDQSLVNKSQKDGTSDALPVLREEVQGDTKKTYTTKTWIINKVLL